MKENEMKNRRRKRGERHINEINERKAIEGKSSEIIEMKGVNIMAKKKWRGE